MSKYIDVVQDLVDEYNSNVHRTIGMRPLADVNHKDQESIRKMLRAIKAMKKSAMFKVGDGVRISKYKRLVFFKGCTLN